MIYGVAVHHTKEQANMIRPPEDVRYLERAKRKPRFDGSRRPFQPLRSIVDTHLLVIGCAFTIAIIMILTQYPGFIDIKTGAWEVVIDGR